MSTDVRLAFDDVLRAAIRLGNSQVYADDKPERKAWVRDDQRKLDKASCAFWRTLNEEK